MSKLDSAEFNKGFKAGIRWFRRRVDRALEYSESYHEDESMVHYLGVNVKKHKFEVGDVVFIEREPTQWASGADGSFPLMGNCKFPFQGIIEKVNEDPSSSTEKHISIRVSGFGFGLNHLIEKNNIVLKGHVR